MPSIEIKDWPKEIRQRYENYLKTLFFFKDPLLRASFERALREGDSLLKEPPPEAHRGFETGMFAHELADECFPDCSAGLSPALIDRPLYTHQMQAIRTTHIERKNLVVATGTASGKTESFLYPILFELYRQHLEGKLEEPGVRAMILYPMNALANDQRERLGSICQDLQEGKSDFKPTFGQYIGQTPNNSKDKKRNAKEQERNRRTNECVFRDEMRQSPPHILLTNYSMLEYLLIRPDDSPLFDGGLGRHWQFLVLDEAHQYRGAKDMEMGMLIRRLKQRLRDGGRQGPIRCITSSRGDEDKLAVAKFASELFEETFSASSIIFGEPVPSGETESPKRYHAFLRALEGAFLVHRENKDVVVLNRKSESIGGVVGVPIEIALCRECGQHYYVGREREGKLEEADRDPSHPEFGVDYYLPADDGNELLCKTCGALSKSEPICDCGTAIPVKKCDADDNNPDQLKKCEACHYRRGGGIGDPVQEIVHGSDGPNAVIATALHELLPEKKRKTLAFADSRQEAAFFAWYAQETFEKLRDRNFILRAIRSKPVGEEGLSIDDLRNRLHSEWEKAELFCEKDTQESKTRQTFTSILREALTAEKRLSLSGVGHVMWFVALPKGLNVPDIMEQEPWKFTENEARLLISYLLDKMRQHQTMNLPGEQGVLRWDKNISPWPQRACSLARPNNQTNVWMWGGERSAIVNHFLKRILSQSNLSNDEEKRSASVKLMTRIWLDLRQQTGDKLLVPANGGGIFRLNPSWARIKPTDPEDLWECDRCATLSNYNFRGVCPRNLCPGTLGPACQKRLATNHYRLLYENSSLPPKLNVLEHTAQIEPGEARKRQDEFKKEDSDIHLLSSSTTFEVGVDLGNLDSVFLRNVPPESFNYVQRAGRAGRRDSPGLVLTYCRRNPHDLYHYEDPDRVIRGEIYPPRLQMKNETIVLRHMVAVVLSAFFNKHVDRFKKVESFVVDWRNPKATQHLQGFCKNNSDGLKSALCRIVPEEMHGKIGLENDEWIVKVAGEGSRLALAEKETCADYTQMEELWERFSKQRDHRRLSRIGPRMKTISAETTLNFLSRKAVIPKYGFPVDVVELDVRSGSKSPASITLQRDLSQAIAEYAPGGKVVANKLEWKSCGIKVVPDRAWRVRHYSYDDARNFSQWNEGDDTKADGARKYLVPEFGFVAPLFEKLSAPKGRAQRLYTTRPFFPGFDKEPKSMTIHGVQMTKAEPGLLVILCEGRNRQGFHICRTCGSHHISKPDASSHKSPLGRVCRSTLEKFSLGHELVTDVTRLQFPKVQDEWDAYSVAYAVLLGAADTLGVPDTDLNVTITGIKHSGESAVVLYDNVPGGAGLVGLLENEQIFDDVLDAAKKRVSGGCGCNLSCYGCLRSYRNQFAHAHLNRTRALEILTL